MAAPHHTQSHLLNRILQRQISQLESENATLKARVARLESRVTDSTAKHRAIKESAADDITNAAAECQSISREAERVAKVMVEQLRHPQNRLAEVAQDIRHEQARLARAISEFYATLDGLPGHAKRDAAAMIRSAHVHQERLLAELTELYDAEGMLRTSDSESRIRARRIEAQAAGLRRQLTSGIEREHQRHTARITHAHEQARALVQALATCRESITRLQGNVQKKDAEPRAGTTVAAAKAARPARPDLVSSNTPHQEEKVIEIARRALEDEPNPSTPPVQVSRAAAPAITRIQYDTDTVGALPQNDVAIAPARPRPYLQIGLGLAAFVVLVVVVVTLM